MKKPPKPRVIGRIDLETGKWIFKTKWYYWNALKEFFRGD